MDKLTIKRQKIKHMAITKCINNWADSANFKGVTLNKPCSGLKGKCFEMPNASYTNRCHSLWNAPKIEKYEENKKYYKGVWTFNVIHFIRNLHIEYNRFYFRNYNRNCKYCIFWNTNNLGNFQNV